MQLSFRNQVDDYKRLNSKKLPKIDLEMKKFKRYLHVKQLKMSRHEQEAVKERYKPKILHQAIKLYGSRTEKATPFDEVEFKLKIREAVLRLRDQESGYVEQIFYTQLDPSRRSENTQQKPSLMLKNCRQHLELMEKYIQSAVKDFNSEFKAREKDWRPK